MADNRPTEWLARYRTGDSEAARLLFEHFAARLCRLAQRHLSQRVRTRADGEDVVQSVFRSFFVRDAQGQFHIDSRDDLWRLLVRITLRKARGVWRLNTAECRDVGQEATSTGDDTDWVMAAIAREPTVVEALVLADEIGTLVAGLSEQHARLLELRLAGHSVTEAAAAMGVSRQAAHRLLEPLQERLQRRNESLPP